ncbi:MAG: hypothetical protein BWX47_01372 [candidate division Hyd24-12 bacterium ADurb.Bin004]|nr:MAG: hypothetical protein BWX47_01372 [candidate division Hyd24-12 bacterium ADurb.Bin004]
MFMATLAAPPGIVLAPPASIETTGTGASGEILSTRPSR